MLSRPPSIWAGDSEDPPLPLSSVVAQSCARQELPAACGAFTARRTPWYEGAP